MVLEGLDATGKSSLCREIKRRYEAQGVSCAIKTEFSSTFVGEGIDKVIAKHRFFKLDQGLDSYIADMMVILADAFCKYEIDVRPQFEVAVMERGVISALAYQLVRLYRKFPAAAKSEMEKSLLAFINASGRISAWPNCHFLLQVTPDELDRRILQRSEPKLTDDEKSMLMEVQKKMQSFGSLFRTIDIKVDSQSDDMLATKIIDLFEKKCGTKSKPKSATEAN